MTKHKHADLMMQYAQDAMETDKPWLRWEYQEEQSSIWRDCIDEDDMCFVIDYEYRRIDPYRHLKEAQERGEVIQVTSLFNPDGKWYDKHTGDSMYWDMPPKFYRIKHKQKKKLYKWAFKSYTPVTNTEMWMETECYYETKEEARNRAYGCAGLIDSEIIRIDSSMIEVES